MFDSIRYTWEDFKPNQYRGSWRGNRLYKFDSIRYTWEDFKPNQYRVPEGGIVYTPLTVSDIHGRISNQVNIEGPEGGIEYTHLTVSDIHGGISNQINIGGPERGIDYTCLTVSDIHGRISNQVNIRGTWRGLVKHIRQYQIYMGRGIPYQIIKEVHGEGRLNMFDSILGRGI